MKLGVIGCGYVFDHYMTTLVRHPGVQIVGVADIDEARAAQVGSYYGLQVYPDSDSLLADPDIECVANFTSIPAHYQVCRAALEAGKHVYSEKPLTTTLEEAEDLVERARDAGLHLCAAPSNHLSATVRTLWQAVADGQVGPPRLVYAEFDDNPVYLLSPETWRSRSGAPWPYLHEYEMGCTWEHAGYHLAWMLAILGPVRALTAFSCQTLPDKTDRQLDPSDTPDFSVAVLAFESGVTGRLTCSIAAPSDHRMRIIGRKGELSAETYRDYDCPVHFEAFEPSTLKARNFRSLRRGAMVGRLLGIGGRRLPLLPAAHPGISRATWDDRGGLGPRTVLKRLRRKQYGLQDKAAGLAEMAAALAAGRAPAPPPEFTLHLTELTLAIQAAGPEGVSYRPRSRFDPLPPPLG